MPNSVQDVTGWPLDDAQAVLSARAIRLLETAPPRPMPPGSQPGEWRVLRWREVGDAVELMVAREQVAECPGHE